MQQQQFPLWAWIAFAASLLLLLAIDLYSHRKDEGESRKRAIVWSVIWISAGLAFNVFVWVVGGAKAGQEYLAAYLIEKSLSLDNLFVFLIIFRNLGIPKDHQRRGLSWGVFGALVFRAVFIFVGAAALRRWEWVEYVFAVILLYAAYRSIWENPAEETHSKVVEWLSRRFPVSNDPNTSQFIVKRDNRYLATPLLIAVLALEATDIVFAVDSVPAAFAVTRDEFIVYSSNAFAILGLRSLYLVLATTIAGLPYLHYGLAAVLAFAGAKIVVSEWVEIPPLVSVGIIAVLIGGAVWASLRVRTQA